MAVETQTGEDRRIGSTLVRAAAVWCLIVPVAVVNGAFRLLFIIPLTGEVIGHIVSTLLLCLLIIAVAAAAARWIGAAAPRRQIAAGSLWLALTVAFEFLAGHYLFGNSWERLLANYDILSGRVWVLVLIVTFLGPWLGWRLREELRRDRPAPATPPST